jgi:RNA polymerase sigma-70 factor (ECF subfamily)
MQEPNFRIITAFSYGDPNAFTRIYNHYYPWLFLFALKYVKQEDAEDILANIFQKLWETRTEFIQVKNLGGYLRVMTRNACINFNLREKKKSEITKDISKQMETEAEEHFVRSQIHAELVEFVNKEIKKFSPKYRTVFKLAFVEGLKNEEIASRLDMSDQVVRNIKSQIRKALRINYFEGSLMVALLLTVQCLIVVYLPKFPMLPFF